MQFFTPMEYLKIDIANNFGKDKLDWCDRISWFDQNQSNLHGLTAQADAPALYYAGVLAYEDALAGRPIGYMVGLDATASGFQVLACLAEDVDAAKICNVINTGHREDAYTAIYKMMLAITGGDERVTRDMNKAAIMPALYGSAAMPKEVFGEGPLLDAFYESMATAAPKVWELIQFMLENWNPHALNYSWVMPDNFHVSFDVEEVVTETVIIDGEPFEVSYKVNKTIQKGRKLPANVAHSVDAFVNRELTRRCDYDAGRVAAVRFIVDKRQRRGTSTTRDNDVSALAIWNQFQQSGYLSVRILDYLDEDNIGHFDAKLLLDLIDSMPAKPFKVTAVHDKFCCLPTYCNDLRKQLNIVYSSIARSDMLSHTLTQIMGETIVVHKHDATFADMILDTDYAIC